MPSPVGLPLQHVGPVVVVALAQVIPAALRVIEVMLAGRIREVLGGVQIAGVGCLFHLLELQVHELRPLRESLIFVEV